MTTLQWHALTPLISRTVQLSVSFPWDLYNIVFPKTLSRTPRQGSLGKTCSRLRDPQLQNPSVQFILLCNSVCYARMPSNLSVRKLSVCLSATFPGIAHEWFQGQKLLLWGYALIQLFPPPLDHLRCLPGILWVPQPQAEEMASVSCQQGVSHCGQLVVAR